MSTVSDVTRQIPLAPRKAAEPARLRRYATAPLTWARSVAVEDWVTAALLAVMLVSVAWAVQLSRWGDLPSLAPMVLIAGAAGMWAARTRVKWYYAQPLALALGFAVIMWQGSIPADGANVALRARDAWDRMLDWVDVARKSGISTDSVPFALMMMAISWVVTYIVSWVTFRFRTPWLPAIGLGVGLLTDLSYRQGRHEQTFFVFILAAVALFAHLQTVRRMERWKGLHIPFPVNLRWLAVRDGVVLGAVVVGIAAALPLAEVKSKSLNAQWKELRRPIDNLREPATRLLAGVRGRDKRAPLTPPGEVLAFQGAISLTEDPLMWVTSRYPTLYPARVYQSYSSQGWQAGPRTASTVPPLAPSGLLPAERSRERIEQRIQPLFSTTTVLPVGGVAAVDRETTVEVLDRPRYVVQLTSNAPAPELPPDLRQLAADIRLAYTDRAAATDPRDMPALVQRLERLLARSSPEDIQPIVLVNPDTGAPVSVVLEREAPFEQVSVKLTEEVLAQDIYTVTTFVSLANDEDLATSGTAYPGWVTDRYLQLPPTLPARVRALAQEIVTRAGAVTPFEKSLAVAAFLRSQVYSQEIAGPRPSKDGVDYFLFDSRVEPCPSTLPDCNRGAIKGYSQYYGSAATVLLRAAGVPSRMVAGWAQGTYVPAEGSFIIRDKDRHGWSQVFFPGYGWIDIEVTPGRRVVPRDEAVPTTPEIDLTRLIGGLSFEEDLLLQQDILEAERAAREVAASLQVTVATGTPFTVPVQVYYALAAFGALIVVSYGAWWGVHRGLDPATRPYTQMVRAGWVLGLPKSPSQTPGEYASAVGATVARAREPAQSIARHYSKLVYAHRPPDKAEAAALSKAWGQVLRSIVSYRLGKLAVRARRRPAR